MTRLGNGGNWPRLKRYAFLALAATSLATLPASTASASEKDFEDLASSLFGAGLHSNPRMVLEKCREAQAKAARFSDNDAWQGLVMECLAHAERIQGNRAAACEYLARAAEHFGKARPKTYEAEKVEEGRRKAMQHRERLGC
jgi:hypothetical protein